MEYDSDEEFSEIITRNLTRYFTAELANEVNGIDEHTRFDNSILSKEEVDLLCGYTQFCEIKSLTSYSNPNIVKIATHKDSFDMEIKDDIRNKIIDKTMTVSEKGEHFQIWLPSTTRDLTSKGRINQAPKQLLVWVLLLFFLGKGDIKKIR